MEAQFTKEEVKFLKQLALNSKKTKDVDYKRLNKKLWDENNALKDRIKELEYKLYLQTSDVDDDDVVDDDDDNEEHNMMESDDEADIIKPAKTVVKPLNKLDISNLLDGMDIFKK